MLSDYHGSSGHGVFLPQLLKGNPSCVLLSQARKSLLRGKFGQLLPDAPLHSYALFSSRCFLERSQFQQNGEESTEICWMPKPHTYTASLLQTSPTSAAHPLQVTSLRTHPYYSRSTVSSGLAFGVGQSMCLVHCMMTWAHSIICMPASHPNGLLLCFCLPRPL